MWRFGGQVCYFCHYCDLTETRRKDLFKLMVLEVLSIMVRKAWWSRDIQFMTSRKQSGAAHIMIGSRERERERGERREKREREKGR
jgi:hypothetical protein